MAPTRNSAATRNTAKCIPASEKVTFVSSETGNHLPDYRMLPTQYTSPPQWKPRHIRCYFLIPLPTISPALNENKLRLCESFTFDANTEEDGRPTTTDNQLNTAEGKKTLTANLQHAG